MTHDVQDVNDNGNVNYNDCDYSGGVRPFWCGRCNIVGETPKLESHNQKNNQPFPDQISGINIKEYKMQEFDKVTEFGNLYAAFKKSRAGHGHNYSKNKFQMNTLGNILRIQQKIEDHSFSVGTYNRFMIHDPKERVIEAGTFESKIVQHSLCDNVLIPSLSKEFITTNFAGQKNKGTLYGLDWLKAHELEAYHRYGVDCWIVKADVSKYFYNINHELLKDMIYFHFADDGIRWLCDQFIESTEGNGLPLGNQISQVFALLYLSGLDHFITGELGIDLYGRYMDDFYLICQGREYAKFCLESIQEYAASLGLQLNQKTQIIPFKNGLKFCGFHTYVTKDGKVIRKILNDKKHTIQKRYRKMAKLVRNGMLDQKTFWESYNSCKDHLSHGNCVKFIHKMDCMIKQILEGSEVYDI